MLLCTRHQCVHAEDGVNTTHTSMVLVLLMLMFSSLTQEGPGSMALIL
jgi:hypothetical protein